MAGPGFNPICLAPKLQHIHNAVITIARRGLLKVKVGENPKGPESPPERLTGAREGGPVDCPTYFPPQTQKKLSEDKSEVGRAFLQRASLL